MVGFALPPSDFDVAKVVLFLESANFLACFLWQNNRISWKQADTGGGGGEKRYSPTVSKLSDNQNRWFVSGSESFIVHTLFTFGRLFILFQTGAEKFTENGCGVAFFTFAAGTAAVDALFVFVDHGGRNDTGGNSYNSVTDKHDDCRQETAQWSDRCDITVAHGCHGDNGPVDAVGNIVEFRTGLCAFNHIHDRAHGSDQNKDEEKENEDFGRTDPQRAQKQVAFVDKKEKFENTEHTDQPERTDDQQIMGAMKEKAEVDRQSGEQIDDAEKTEDVFAWFFQAVDTCQVFYGEEESEQVFQNSQNEIGRIGEYVHTFQNNEQYAQYDTADKQNIEQFAFGRIGFEYDRIDFPFQFIVVQESLPTMTE